MQIQYVMDTPKRMGRPPKNPEDRKITVNYRLDPKVIELLKQFGAVKTIEAAIPYYLAAINAGLIDPPE